MIAWRRDNVVGRVRLIAGHAVDHADVAEVIIVVSWNNMGIGHRVIVLCGMMTVVLEHAPVMKSRRPRPLSKIIHLTIHDS